MLLIQIEKKGKIHPINESYQRAKNLLKENEGQLHHLAKALVKYETLTLEEIKKVVNGHPLIERDKELNEILKDTKIEKTTPPTLLIPTNVEQNME